MCFQEYIVTKVEIAATKAKIEKRKIVMERAIIRQDVMVAPFDFINQIFQDNGWQSLFTSNKVYPRLVREFYMHMEIVQIEQSCPILKTKVRGFEIRIDLALISAMTHISLSLALGIHFLDSVDTPSWENLRMCFDPQGAQDWVKDMTYIPIGWLQSPH